MCLTCNPYCGRCRPPARKAVKCPHCGKDSAFSREECLAYLGYRKEKQKKDALQQGEVSPHCGSCGVDLSDDLRAKVVPMECAYSGIVCGYPCGRHESPKRIGDLDCAKPVPIRRLSADEWAQLTEGKRAV